MQPLSTTGRLTRGRVPEMLPLPLDTAVYSEDSLPQLVPPTTDFELLALSRPAATFTGDFYFSHEGEASLLFAIGDVTGKGLSAAVYMAMIQEALEETLFRHSEAPLPLLVSALDVVFRREAPANRFASLVVGRLGRDGRIALTSAGHCPPLLAHRDGIRTIGSHGTPVGLLPGQQWGQSVIELELGDTLFLYTDGLLEACSAEDEEYGLERIQRLVADHRQQALPVLQATLLADVKAHCGERGLSDDLTLYWIRRTA